MSTHKLSHKPSCRLGRAAALQGILQACVAGPAGERQLGRWHLRMHLKHRFGEVQADCRASVPSRLSRRCSSLHRRVRERSIPPFESRSCSDLERTHCHRSRVARLPHVIAICGPLRANHILQVNQPAPCTNAKRMKPPIYRGADESY
jgi:hypothetical protein